MLPSLNYPFGLGESGGDVGEALLWLVDMSQFNDTQVAQLRACLDRVESEHNSRLQRESHRRRDVISKGVLRYLLSSLLGVPKSELKIERTANGKPYLSSPDSIVRFNTSHSHDCLACAFTRSAEIGVDVEYTETNRDFLSISKLYFSGEESRVLAKLTDDRRREHFFALWTLKEAYVKARGEGIALGLDNFSFSLDNPLQDTAKVKFANPDFDFSQDWYFLRSNNFAKYTAAIALKGPHEEYQLEVRDTASVRALLL